MYKLFSSFLFIISLLIFTGCGNTTTEQATIVKAKVDRNIIQTGEAVEFAIICESDIHFVEWRDIDGKLLSTDEKFNRLFKDEGEYKTLLTITDNNGEVTTDTISVKVTRAPLLPVTPNLAPFAKATADRVDITDEEIIHFGDDGSFDPDGTIIKYEWRDMDGILLSSTKTLDRRLYYYSKYDFDKDGTTKYIKTLTVTDNEGKSASISFTIIVHKKPNNAPVANTQDITVMEDSTNNAITLKGIDEDGDSLTYRIVSNPSNDTLSGSGANWLYTPTPNFEGDDSFSYVVNDGEIDSSIAYINIQVTNITDRPIADSQSITMFEDNRYTITLRGRSLDGNVMQFSIVTQPQNGTLTADRSRALRVDTKVYSYLPFQDFFGVDRFTYRVFDGTEYSDIATVEIDVQAQNDAPTATAQAIIMDEDTTRAITLAGTDADGDVLTYTVVTQPEHGTFNGTIYTSTANYHGSDSFSFTANDGLLDSEPAIVSITINDVAEPNHAPSISSITLYSDDFEQLGENIYYVEAQEPYTITISGEDVDGDSLVYYIDGVKISGNTHTFSAIGRRMVTIYKIKAYDGKVFSDEVTLTTVDSYDLYY